MSDLVGKEKVKGRVQAVNIKPEKNYYQLLVNDSWFNGELGAVTAEHVKSFQGKELELTVKTGGDDFIDIEDIRVEGSKDADQKGDGRDRKSDASGGGGCSDFAGVNSSTSSNNKSVLSLRQSNITAQASVKLAVEHAEVRPEESVGEHVEEVNELARGYANIMENITEEHVE